MKQITIGTKNQIVIPKEIRQKITGLKPGRKVKVYYLDNDTVAIKVAASSWLESSYGAMKKPWSSVNPLVEINKLRDEWE